MCWSENEHKIKIGKTKNHPQVRVDQLNKQTGTIGKYKVEWFVKLHEYNLLEKLLHSIFSDYHSEKEFFDISYENSKEVVEKISKNFKVLYAKGRAILSLQKLKIRGELSDLDKAEKALEATLSLIDNNGNEKKVIETELLKIKQKKESLKNSFP